MNENIIQPELQFSISFRKLIEFVDMDSNGIYDDSIDQTIQEVEQRSPANPKAGLEVVERTITTSRPLSGGGRELKIEVQGRDGSGRLKTIMTQTKTFSN